MPRGSSCLRQLEARQQQLGLVRREADELAVGLGVVGGARREEDLVQPRLGVAEATQPEVDHVRELLHVAQARVRGAEEVGHLAVDRRREVGEEAVGGAERDAAHPVDEARHRVVEGVVHLQGVVGRG